MISISVLSNVCLHWGDIWPPPPPQFFIYYTSRTMNNQFNNRTDNISIIQNISYVVTSLEVSIFSQVTGISGIWLVWYSKLLSMRNFSKKKDLHFSEITGIWLVWYSWVIVHEELFQGKRPPCCFLYILPYEVTFTCLVRAICGLGNRSDCMFLLVIKRRHIRYG